MDPADLSLQVRSRLVPLPGFGERHRGVVPAPPGEERPDLGPVRDRLDRAIRELGRFQALAGETGDPFLTSRVHARREGVASSAIEGVRCTLDAALAADAQEATAHAATRQALDYARILDDMAPRLLAEGASLLTMGLVHDLHARAMRGDAGRRGPYGAFRDAVAWIGGDGGIARSTWNPPPPDRLRGCLADNLAYMRGGGSRPASQDLVTRLAIAHVHFEAVHPYRDGNGRVGRLLLALTMAAEGSVPLYLSPYIEANRAAYYEALKAAQQRLDWGAAIGFFSDAVVATVADVLATRRALAGLRDSWEGRRRFRRGSAAARALDLLPHRPILTIRRLGGLLGVTPTQARLAVDRLVECGILAERTGYARNRVFAAEEVMLIVDRPFGVEPYAEAVEGAVA